MNKESGFSLVELIIVTALVGAIIIIIANVPQAIKLIGSSNNESIAKQIIAEKIESLRSETYDNLANGTTQISDRRLSSLPSSSSSVIVEDCPVTICTNGELVKQVTINLSWKDADKNKNILVTTLIAKGGLQ